MKLHRCKCHGNLYTRCALCACQYCPIYWATCPRCSEIKRVAAAVIRTEVKEQVDRRLAERGAQR